MAYPENGGRDHVFVRTGEINATFIVDLQPNFSFMEKKGILILLVCMTAILAVTFAGCTGTEVQTDKKTYIVGIDAAYPPFTYTDKNGDCVGFDVDSAQWIADTMGFEVEFQPTAWDGIIPALQAGKIDMVYAGMTITEERQEKVNFSIPYWTVNQDVVTLETSDLTIDDVLEGKAIIGAQRGCTAAMWVEANLIETGKMSAENLKFYDNTPLAVDDLKSGRITAVMYDDLVLKDIIAGMPIKTIGNIETNEQFGIAVRKTDTQLLADLNEGLEQLMSDPYWDELKELHNMV
jgi:polar amino acid transport system substrate-binding protein